MCILSIQYAYDYRRPDSLGKAKYEYGGLIGRALVAIPFYKRKLILLHHRSSKSKRILQLVTRFCASH